MYKDYLKIKHQINKEFEEGTFEHIYKYLKDHLNKEYFIVTLPDTTTIDGEDFIENYRSLRTKYLKEDKDSFNKN